MGGISRKIWYMLKMQVRKIKGRSKVRKLQEEMREMVSERKKETAAYEKDKMVFAVKESEWKQEMKKIREEVKILRKMVEDKQERVGPGIEDENKEKCEITGADELLAPGTNNDQRAKRDENGDKWKQLYLAIKMELDILIQCGNGLYWRADEQEDIMVEQLKRELKAKEEMIAGLHFKIVSLENEQRKREREIDILRQSLRIMSSKKTTVLQVAQKVSRDSQPVKKQSQKL